MHQHSGSGFPNQQHFPPNGFNFAQQGQQHFPSHVPMHHCGPPHGTNPYVPAGMGMNFAPLPAVHPMNHPASHPVQHGHIPPYPQGNVPTHHHVGQPFQNQAPELDPTEWPWPIMARILLMVSFHIGKVCKFRPADLLRYMCSQKDEYQDVSKRKDKEWVAHYSDKMHRVAYIWLYFPAALTYTLRSMISPFYNCLQGEFDKNGHYYSYNKNGWQRRENELYQVPEWYSWVRHVQGATYHQAISTGKRNGAKGKEKVERVLTSVNRCRVLILGGGAGSEVAGFQLFVEWLRNKEEHLVQCFNGGDMEASVSMPVCWDTEVVLLDRYGEHWALSAQEMMELTDESELRSSKIPGTDLPSKLVTPHAAFEIHAGRQTDIHFCSYDLLEESSIKAVETITLGFQPDVVIMAKVASVLWSDKRKSTAQKVVSTMLANLPPHASVTVIDNKMMDKLTDFFDGCTTKEPAVPELEPYMAEQEHDKVPFGVVFYDQVDGPFMPQKMLEQPNTLIPFIRYSFGKHNQGQCVKYLDAPATYEAVPAKADKTQMIQMAVCTARWVKPKLDDEKHVPWYKRDPGPNETFKVPPMSDRPAISGFAQSLVDESHRAALFHWGDGEQVAPHCRIEAERGFRDHLATKLMDYLNRLLPCGALLEVQAYNNAQVATQAPPHANFPPPNDMGMRNMSNSQSLELQHEWELQQQRLLLQQMQQVNSQQPVQSSDPQQPVILGTLHVHNTMSVGSYAQVPTHTVNGADLMGSSRTQVGEQGGFIRRGGDVDSGLTLSGPMGGYASQSQPVAIESHPGGFINRAGAGASQVENAGWRERERQTVPRMGRGGYQGGRDDYAGDRYDDGRSRGWQGLRHRHVSGVSHGGSNHVRGGHGGHGGQGGMGRGRGGGTFSASGRSAGRYNVNAGQGNGVKKKKGKSKVKRE